MTVAKAARPLGYLTWLQAQPDDSDFATEPLGVWHCSDLGSLGNLYKDLDQLQVARTDSGDKK